MMKEACRAMVADLRRYRISDARVLAAMETVARHRFIPEGFRRDPYGDHPVPIGFGQTISQPFIVAYMIQQLRVVPGMRILEIGCGSGYQAAVLAEMGAQVFTMETVPELAAHARRVLDEEGYASVSILCADGYAGWPEHAPYDAIVAACAPPSIPAALVDQLRDGGRMILPVGEFSQQLMIVEKEGDQVRTTSDMHVRFVPMVPCGSP